MSLVTRKRKKSDINIIPLVDVLMVLIFFFLMTMQFKNEDVLNITPPKIETAGSNALTEQILIAIGPEGEFYLNNHPVNEEQLEKALEIAGENNPDQPILLVSDEETALKHVTKVMDWARGNNMNKLKLKSR
ncbi:MAG: biopolymer transporter ExbD [Opitutales bacterium]|nr:biopolymer transporter ExbD [Opitutales bacterium]